MRSTLNLAVMLLAISPFVLLTGSGCIESTLAEARFDVTKRFHDAAGAYVTAGRTYAAFADEMASKKHALQKEVADEKWDAWLARHTDADGRLVSVAADGSIKPMARKDLLKSVEARDEHLDRLRDSKTIWSTRSGAWVAALDSFGIANVETLETQRDIREAEREADELARRALTFIGTIAAGAAAAGL